MQAMIDANHFVLGSVCQGRINETVGGGIKGACADRRSCRGHVIDLTSFGGIYIALICYKAEIWVDAHI